MGKLLFTWNCCWWTFLPTWCRRKFCKNCEPCMKIVRRYKLSSQFPTPMRWYTVLCQQVVMVLTGCNGNSEKITLNCHLSIRHYRHEMLRWQKKAGLTVTTFMHRAQISWKCILKTFSFHHLYASSKDSDFSHCADLNENARKSAWVVLFKYTAKFRIHD